MPRNRKSVHPFFLSVVFLFVLSLISTAAFAQPGKISAKLIDAKSGEPLFKGSIQIQETKQGALSKDNGVATIINVAPSETYTVVAKYAGYQPVTITNVKVQSDLTTKLEFKLSSKTQDTIIVAADKLVDLTQIGIAEKLSGSKIQTIAGTQNITQVVALTPGLVRDGSNGGFSIHGSRGTDNSIRINNIETSNVVTGGESITQTAVSKFAISEINITTAGGDASKGNTTGGEINTNTRSGGTSFEFMFKYRQDIPSIFGTSGNGYKMMGADDKTYELAFGGPITEDVKIFITAKGNSLAYLNAGLAVTDPSGNNLGHLQNDAYYIRGGTAKISFDLLGLHLSADAVLSSVNQQFTTWAWTYGDQAEIPARNLTDNIFTLDGNTGIGSTGILKVTAGYQTTSRRTGKYDASQGGGLFSLYKIYDAKDEFSYDDNTHTVTAVPDGIVDIYTPVSHQIADPRNPSNILNLTGAGINPFTGHIEGQGISNTTNNPYGLLGSFLTVGNVYGFDNLYRKQISLNAQYNDQFGSHGFDAGFEAHLHNLDNFSNSLPWDANPFRDSFSVKPLMAAVFVGDKMEFSDITFQPSLRFDIYDPGNNHVLLDPYTPLIYVDGVPQGNFSKAPVQTQLSPRLGITYAVSDITTFSFNYGLYFKQPKFLEVLTNTGGNFSSVLARGNQIIGNGTLRGETDEAITVGFTTGLTDALKLTVNGIYKNMRHISGLARITSSNLALGYSLYTDDQYGNYKGIELSLEKRMSDHFSARFNYTYSTTKGTSSSATENYFALLNQGTDVEIATLPLTPFPLDFDRTHVAQFILSAVFGKGEGPKIGDIAFLENFNFNTTTVFQSGVPYTAFDPKGQQTGEHNGARQPSYFQTDATIDRNIPLADIFGDGIGTSSLTLQLEILNLLNRTDALYVYPTSGQADDDGVNPVYTGATDFINDPTNASGNQLDQLGMLKYNARWDINRDGRVSVDEQTQAFKLQRKDSFARRTNYQVPRRFYMNFTLHF